MYVDGNFVSEISLYSRSVQERQVVFKNYDTNGGYHTITVRDASSAPSVVNIDGAFTLEQY